MYKTDSKRIPDTKKCPEKELVGKYVRIASNAGRNYNKFGRITGFTKNGDQAQVYISETKCLARFYLSSLELLH